MRALFVLLGLMFVANVAMAQTSLGSAAININGIVAFIYEVLHVILYIGAGIMGMSGLLKLRLHRRNPQQMPLSMPLTELSLCGVFILLAVLVQFSVSNRTVNDANLPAKTVAPPPNAYPY